MADIPLSREELDEVLFQSMRAIYFFEREKVRRFGLSFMAIYVLQLLRRHSPLRMRDVVEELGIPFSSATRLIARLENMKFVERVSTEDDRRGVSIHLCDAGNDVIRSIEDDSFFLISKNISDFSGDSISGFIETARNMGKILSVDGANKSSLNRQGAADTDRLEIKGKG
ncbi:MAG: MarR family transcriptional regulator [Deltaproteobacteria bacterium]|nr:MarR family transcriptional regulator [Deltaproteobacteria bacterium]